MDHRNCQHRARSVTHWKGIGMAAGIFGAFVAGAWNAPKANADRPASAAAPAPGLTSQDIGEVRDELRAIQGETNRRFEILDQRLSHLEGYVQGKEAKALR